MVMVLDLFMVVLSTISLSQISIFDRFEFPQISLFFTNLIAITYLKYKFLEKVPRIKHP
ncbi:hypothetical protein Hanom_Chr00s032196g01770431 [Helianthus anomalus]